MLFLTSYADFYELTGRSAAASCTPSFAVTRLQSCARSGSPGAPCLFLERAACFAATKGTVFVSLRIETYAC